MNIRQGRPEDLERVIEMERECDTAPHWPVAEYERIFIGGPVLRCLLVAEVRGRPVGFAVGKIAAGTGELESLVVEPSARRIGIGRALCAGMVGWCLESGAENVELEVRAGSLGVIRLYTALGFEGVGLRQRYYSEPLEDALLMRLKS